jgi:ABC-type glycerol-3-phosphate transport system substrate-binding protein
MRKLSLILTLTALALAGCGGGESSTEKAVKEWNTEVKRSEKAIAECFRSHGIKGEPKGAKQVDQYNKCLDS